MPRIIGVIPNVEFLRHQRKIVFSKSVYPNISFDIQVLRKLTPVDDVLNSIVGSSEGIYDPTHNPVSSIGFMHNDFSSGSRPFSCH